MSQSHGNRTGIAFLLSAATIIFSLASHADAQSTQPLPEPLPLPPTQVPYGQDYPSTVSPPATDSAFFLESSSFATATESLNDFSATMAPTVADESGQVITTHEDKQALLALPGTQGWFAQVDYFLWRETVEIEGTRYKLLDETGPMFSVGYHAHTPRKRYRIAIFGGSPAYDGATMDYEPLSSQTDYIGVVGEYDFRWPLFGSPRYGFFAGIGTRLWSRNLQNSFTDSGRLAIGYKETWWTIYPRVGLDSMRQFSNGVQLYSSGSIGYTAYTVENIELFDETLHPEGDFYTRAEIGLRYQRLFLSLMVERFRWNKSDDKRGFYQPRSTMISAGMFLGYHF